MATVQQTDTTARRLAALEADVQQLRRRDRDREAVVHQLQRRVRDLEADQHDADAALLSAIAVATGGRVFDAAELLAAMTAWPDLAAALDGHTTPRSVGRRLARLSRAGPHRGLRVRALDARGERGCIWFVEIQEPSSVDDGR